MAFERLNIRRGYLWVDFDIDNASGNFKDPRIQRILAIFGEDRALIQYRPESGNFSLLFRTVPLLAKDLQSTFTQIFELSQSLPKSVERLHFCGMAL